MNNINNYAKILTVSAAVLLTFLVFSVSAVPLNAQASSTNVTLNMPSQIGPENPLYKYLFHVPITKYGDDGVDPSRTLFNPDATAPNTNHLLWIAKVRPWETLGSQPIMVAGNVITSVGSGQSAYNNLAVTYAFDQYTGKIMWTYPSVSPSMAIDDTHLLCGTTMINPNTGQFLYTVPTSISLYVPELKMGFRTSSGRVEGWDFSNFQNPTRLWQTADRKETTSPLSYGDGKIFVEGNLIEPYVRALDAKTGNVLWETLSWGTTRQPCAYMDGKILWSYLTGFRAYDANTGKLLWQREITGKAFSPAAVAYGKVYTADVNSWFYCFDAATGEVVWKYIGEIDKGKGYPSAGDAEAERLVDTKAVPIVADHKVYFLTRGPTRYGTLLPPHYTSPDGLLKNPYDYPVVAQSGIGEFSCVDAEHGNLIWKIGPEEVGAPGIYVGTGMAIADGMIVAAQETMSGHISVGSTNSPNALYPYNQIINYEWFPGNLYCFAKGPVQMTVSTDKKTVGAGQSVTITGTAVDLSQPIDHVSSLSTYSRPAASPAMRLPIKLSWQLSDGSMGDLATVKTDKDGKFSVNWAPSKSGTWTIIASSNGNDAYETPADVNTTITVSGGITLSTVGSIAGIIAITVSAAAITVPIRKRKQQGGEQLE